jgi:hypothetical protein
MIGLETARKLKAAGLHWEPAQGDRFAVPERGMDDRVFVINDMATIIEMIQGAEMVTFHGTPEWALDYVYLGEAVWLPDEGQLRERLHALLMNERPPVYDLVFMDDVFTCRFEWCGELLAFRSEDVAEVYAAALLHVMGA